MLFFNFDSPGVSEALTSVFGEDVPAIEKLNDPKIQELIQAKHDQEVTGLKKNRDQLMDQVKASKTAQSELDELKTKFDGVDPDEYRELKENGGKPGTEELQNKLDSASGQIKDLKAETDSLKQAAAEHQALAEKRQQENNRILVAQDVSAAISAVSAKNPDSGVMPGAEKYLLQQAEMIFRRDKNEETGEVLSVPFKHDAAMYGKSGKMTPEEWVEAFRETDSWLFKGPVGSGAVGGKGGGATNKKFSELSETELVALSRDNPEHFKKLKQEHLNN